MYYVFILKILFLLKEILIGRRFLVICFPLKLYLGYIDIIYIQNVYYTIIENYQMINSKGQLFTKYNMDNPTPVLRIKKKLNLFQQFQQILGYT